jgi:hypothetical protein
LLYIAFGNIENESKSIQLIEDKQEIPEIRHKTHDSKIAKRIEIAVDIKNPITRSYSLQIAQKYPGSYNINQIASIYIHIKSNWKYISDPTSEDYFSKASESIENNLAGDCDDFAILLSALVSSIGGSTRINFARTKDSAHAYTEVKIANSTSEFRALIESMDAINLLTTNNAEVNKIHYREDRSGAIWMNLDWTSPHIEGEYYRHQSITTLYPLSGYFVTSTSNSSRI